MNTSATGTAAINGTGKTSEDILDLDKEEETAVAGIGKQLKTFDSPPEQNGKEAKTEIKKVKVTVEIESAHLDEIKVLTTLGICFSREDFIVDAVNEKRAEVMSKLRNSVRKR